MNIEPIMEKICDLCHWPYVEPNENGLEDECSHCESCTIEEEIMGAVQAASNDAADALERLKAERDELTEKHWSECRQIAEYDDEARRGGRRLNEGLPVRT